MCLWMTYYMLPSSTVINCLELLFSMSGMPDYVHSDRGHSFISGDLKEYLLKRGVATSNSTPYHPQGNCQAERYVGAIWKTIQLALRSHKLPDKHWEQVLPQVLHSMRSLLCRTTNCTSHERFFFNSRDPWKLSSIMVNEPGAGVVATFRL